MAQSWARRLNFWNDQPRRRIFGTRISVSSSSGSQGRLEEARGRTRPAAIVRAPARTLGDEGAAEGQHRGRQVGGRVAVGDRPADGAAVADLGVADLAGHVGQHGHVGGAARSRSPVAVAGEGADGDVVAARRGRRTGRAAGRCRSAPTARPAAASSAAAASGPRRAAWRRRPCSASRPTASSSELGPAVVEGGRDHARYRPPRHRRRQHRLDDVVVAGAAAEVALEALAHLGLGRVGCSASSETAAMTIPGVQ